MANPLFWLGLSLLLVAISLLVVLAVAVSLMRELARACRSAERLCDILARDVPPTLEAIRLTGLELTELTDDVNEGIHHAGEVIRQVDQGLTSARHQAQQVRVSTHSLWAGFKAAWQAWQTPPRSPRRKRPRRLHSRHGHPTTHQPSAPKASGRRSTSHRPATSPSSPGKSSPAPPSSGDGPPPPGD